MLEESIEYAEQDFSERQLIEARQEGDAILQATEMALAEEQAAELSPEEGRKIDQAMSALRAAMTGSDYKLIRTLSDELNQATLRLAELMMNRVLQTTLEGKRVDKV